MEIKVGKIATATTNGYLFKKGKCLALIDTLPRSAFRRLESFFRDEGYSLSDVRYVLLTHHHYDHAGNAKKVKELSGAKIVCGIVDAPFVEGKEPSPGPSNLSLTGRILRLFPESLFRKYQAYDPVEVDIKVTDGDVIDELGLEVLSVPGHTPGSVCYVDRKHSMAFTGDIVSNFFGKCGLPFLSFSENLEEIMRSVERLSLLGLEHAYPGHGRIIEAGASSKIGKLRERKEKKS